jgi:hypothetical protein
LKNSNSPFIKREGNEDYQEFSIDIFTTILTEILVKVLFDLPDLRWRGEEIQERGLSRFSGLKRIFNYPT